jgi:glycosyltransferase involved in cell wall biosynthesis
MKILVLTNMLPVPSRPSFGVFVKEQIEDLRRLGLEVAVVFVDGSASRVNYLRGVARLQTALDRFPADLVHAHYGLTGAVAVTQRGAPVVTTFHGSDCNGERPWQTVVSWVVARLCTPVFVSAELAKGIGRKGAAVIPAAVDLDVFQPTERREARRALGWPEEGFVALLPGSRSVRRKRADLFDAALEHAGKTVPKLRAASLEGLAREKVALVMNAVDVTVMTSNYEGSPVAVKESLACLTPVVSVPVGDVQSFLEDMPGCAIVPRKPERIAAALVTALDAGRPPVLRERAAAYSRPLMAERVLDVYRKMLSSDRRSP